MKNIIIGLVLVAFSSPLFASEWSVSTKIEQIVVGYPGDQILFNTTAAIHNPAGCGANYYTVSPEYTSADHILSVLLTAQSQDKAIIIGVDTASCATLGNYPKVLKVRLDK